MFTDAKKPRSQQGLLSQQNTIAQGTTFEGDLKSEGDFRIEINVGDNFRINKPLTSRIAYSAIIDVITMGVAQLKPEAQEQLYNIVDSQRSLKIK